MDCREGRRKEKVKSKRGRRAHTKAQRHKGKKISRRHGGTELTEEEGKKISRGNGAHGEKEKRMIKDIQGKIEKVRSKIKIHAVAI